MNNLSGTYCFSHRSFSTTKLPLRKSICSRKSYPYLKQVIFFIFLKYGEYVYAVHTIYMYNRDSDVQIVSNDDFWCEILKKDLEVKKKCVSLQPVSEKGVFETFWDETASSLKNEKIWKKFWRFWKSCYLCSPVRKDAGSKKEDHWKDWKTKYKEVQLSTEKTIRER